MDKNLSFSRVVSNETQEVLTALKSKQRYRLQGSQVIKVPVNNNVFIEHEVIDQQQKVYVFVDQQGLCTFRSMCKKGNKLVDVEYYFFVQKDAQLQMFFELTESVDVQCKLFVYLQGQHAQADIKGLYVLNGQQKLSLQTYQYHTVATSTSRLTMKGMLTDQAKANYQGLIFIDEDAVGVDAGQENKNIVLDSRAKVVSIPSIEVLQHDVQCCHGSAIGRFDKHQLWYLQSKGLSALQAQRLLVQSFFDEVIMESMDKSKVMELVCQKIL